MCRIHYFRRIIKRFFKTLTPFYRGSVFLYRSGPDRYPVQDSLKIFDRFLGGHAGGLELWNLHRCAAGCLTFPNDFPETPAGAKYVKDELTRLNQKSEKLPKSKNPLHDIDLLENVSKFIPSPPGVHFTTSKGRLKNWNSKFLSEKCPKSGKIEIPS